MILTVSCAYAQVGYPPPSNSIIIHSTTVTFSGPPSTTITLDVSKVDSQSVVTQISFSSTVPLSSIGVQIYQLSAIPSGTPSPGTTALIVQINIPTSIDVDITTATIDLKVPQSSISSAGLNPSSLVVQRYSQGSWTSLSTKVLQSDSQYVYLQAQSPGLSLFSVTGTQAAAPFPWFLVVLVILVIVIATTFVVVLRRRQSKR